MLRRVLSTARNVFGTILASLRLKRFRVWKEVKVVEAPPYKVLQSLYEHCAVSYFARQLILSSKTPALEVKMKLARSTVRKLGFTTNPKKEEVFTKIQELGHRLCPPEVAPHLTLMLTDRSEPLYLHLAMQPVLLRSGAFVFLIVHERGRHELSTSNLTPGIPLDLEDEVVFVLAD